MRNRLVVCWAFLAAGCASGATISPSGTFVNDDEVVVFPITVPVGGSLVTARTLSYAAGGFDPVLSLFGPVGPLFLLALDDNSGSTCGLAPVCLDAEISTFLPAGEYWVALTEADNFPNGPQFLDGFSRDGEGNFTGGPFTDFLGNPRTGEFLVEISGVVAPEPRAVVVAGLAVMWWLRRRSRLRGPLHVDTSVDAAR